MKVKLTVTITVDRFDWAQEYGTDTTAEDVRRDVRSYFQTHIEGAPAISDAGLTVHIA